MHVIIIIVSVCLIMLGDTLQRLFITHKIWKTNTPGLKMSEPNNRFPLMLCLLILSMIIEHYAYINGIYHVLNMNLQDVPLWKLAQTLETKKI